MKFFKVFNIQLLNILEKPNNYYINHLRYSKYFPSILNIYIFKEILGPFIVALFFFTMIYMMIALQEIIGLLISKGIDPIRLMQYMFYLLMNTIPNTIPMACLMSGIMASGRLSSDSEITAMRSAGISFLRINVNFIFFGFFTALFVAYLNFYLAPENTRKMNEFNKWVLAYNPLLAVTPGQFSGDRSYKYFEKKSRTMYTGGFDNDSKTLKEIQIREWTLNSEGNDFVSIRSNVIPIGKSKITQIIFAKSGNIIQKLNINQEFENSIRLKNGFIIEWNEDEKGLTVTNFLNGEMDYNVPKEKEKKVLEINIKPDTFSLPMLYTIKKSIESEGLEKIPGLEMLEELGLSIKGMKGLKSIITNLQIEIIKGQADGSLKSDELTQRFTIYSQLNKLYAEGEKVLTSFNIEINKRIATPISCQIFLFLSFPLGLVARRSGKGMSFTLAIVFIMIYYLFLIFGNGLSYKKNVPDWLGPWSANIVIGLISIHIMVTRTDVKLPFFLKKYPEFVEYVKSKLTNLISNIILLTKKYIMRK